MRTVFLDTVGLIATWDEDDQWHPLAEPVFRALVQQRLRLATTPLVLYECGNAAARKTYRSDVEAFRRELAAFGDLIEPTAEELERAWADYARGLADSAGIVDHISFTVMRRLSLSEAFTNDRHFRAAGFHVLF
jgi:predicted nucleic acid-binding protein